jgi:general L-amino acid transport system ATP-binding protein
MTSSPTLMIEARGVEKWYPNGFHALRGIDLNVHQGEVVVIMGPSGSGKSTFLRTFNAMEDFQKGSIVVDGIEISDDLRRIDAIRREVGMVFQQFNLFPHLTVLDNLTLAPVKVRKRPKVSSLAASSSGWRLLARFAWSPASCCLTSPPVPWIPRWCRRCWR